MPEISNIIGDSSIVREPGAYRINEISLINSQSREYDIQAIVTDFKIIESLYLPFLILELNIKDSLNLLEELRLSGQEVVRISYTKDDIYGSVDITKEFIVSEYPLYGKASDRIQVYSLRAISFPAFLNNLKRLSRSFNGEIQDLIEDILLNDLDTKLEIKTDIKYPLISGIYPRIKPFKAINWFLSRAFDSDGNPLYLTETVLSGHSLISYSDIINREVYRSYDNRTAYSYDPIIEADKDYEQRVKRILNIVSDIRLSKFIPGSKGAFASRTHFLDIHSKKYTTLDYSYDGDEISDRFIYPLNKFNESTIHMFNIDSTANRGINYFEDLRHCKANTITETMDTFVHDVELNGDPQLEVGKLIDLNLSQAIDPKFDIEGYENTSDHSRDEYLSGSHIVTGIIHNFGKRYSMNVRVNKNK